MFLVIVHCLHYILDETNRQGFKQTQQSRLAPRSFVVKRRKIDYRLRKIVSVISLVPRMGRPAFERSAAGRRRTAYRRIDGVTATGAKTKTFGAWNKGKKARMSGAKYVILQKILPQSKKSYNDRLRQLRPPSAADSRSE